MWLGLAEIPRAARSRAEVGRGGLLFENGFRRCPAPWETRAGGKSCGCEEQRGESAKTKPDSVLDA